MNAGIASTTGLWVTVLTVGLATITASDSASRLDRENLLEYRNRNGEIVPVRSVRDWRVRRAEILVGMQAIMGPLPDGSKRVPLDVRLEDEKDFGSYVRRFISYAAEPGSRTPAHLFVPKAVLDGSERRPGVLCLMPTGGYRLTDAPTPSDASTSAHVGEHLARHGFVAIAPAYPSLGFGSRQALQISYDPNLRELGYQSGTMKAIWDNIRALDLLRSLPYVKSTGFGVIGHSLGGHNSIFTAVFDERIKVIVSSCGFDSFQDYYSDVTPSVWNPGRGWTQETYMPRLANMDPEEIPFDFHELVGALAPRALFVNAPVGDTNFKWRSVDRVIAAGAQIYRLYDIPGLIRVEHPDAGHAFPPEVMEAAFTWMEQHL